MYQMKTISGGYDAFDALVYGNQSQGNIDYFQSQIALLPTIKTVGEIGRSFLNNAVNTYERFNGSEAMRLFRAAKAQAATLFQPEIIKSLWDITNFQTASLTMQRWVMANTVVRTMYHEQRCDGYSDTYVDVDPGKIGKDHYDWRRVMDGVVVNTDDSWEANFYIEDIRQGDRLLDSAEKADILTTWQIAEMFMSAADRDPTSAWNSNL